MNEAVCAVFDLDGTLTEGGSLESRFIRYLWRRGRIPPQNLLRSASFFLRHFGHDPVTALKCNKLYLKGMTPADASTLAREFMSAMAEQLLASGRWDLLSGHRLRGETTVLLTGSPKFLVEALVPALNLRFDHLFATALAVEEGLLTGLVQSPHYYGSNKKDRAAALPAELGVSLEHSWCYADSFSDLPMMLLFGRPVAVSPDKALHQEALKRHWKIIM
jgi:HAD superfamily hydrolase (TIGR01490 family)